MDTNNTELFSFNYEGTKGERCDAAVTMRLRELEGMADLSRTRVQALIEAGGVYFDGKLVPRGQKNLRPGMLIEVDLAMLKTLLTPIPGEFIRPADIPIEFLHLDERIAVLVKPAGLTVHPADTTREDTLVGALLHHLGQLSDEGGADRPGIVHRLDKETSGLMVIARDNLAHVALSRQFAERSVEKEYNALCIDAPDAEVGRIELPVGRHPYNRKLMWARGHGKPALTEYRVAANVGPFPLLDLVLHSGRTHQIRVHLQTLGVGIINDEKYAEARNTALRSFLKNPGYRQAPRFWKEELPNISLRRSIHDLLESYPGIFLHARRLSFVHPGSGQRMEFEAPPPPVWQELQVLCDQSIESGQ